MRSRRSAGTARASPRSAAFCFLNPCRSRRPRPWPRLFWRRSLRHPRAAPVAESRDQLVRGRGAPGARGVGMHGRWVLDQWFEDPPGLFDAVLTGEARAVAAHRVEQQHLIGRRSLAALLGELDGEGDRLRAPRVGAMRIEDQARTGRGVELDDELVGFRAPALAVHEAEARRGAEYDAQLRLRGGKLLAGADEPRHAR